MILKRISIVFILVVTSISLIAQYTSIHHEQSEFYQQYQNYSEQDFNQLNGITNSINTKKSANCNLEYEVYGWHPFWVGTAYNSYDFNLLSTFSYFSYELNPLTGNYNSIHDWKTTNSINLAQSAGARVELCVTNFGSSNNNTFLTNMAARQTLIDSLISLLAYRNADGVNIDFEGVSGSNRNHLTSFMTDLSNQLKTARPGSTVSMATYSVDWNNVFDFVALSNVVDQFIIMGYGYYYSGSSVAGPTDPLYSGTLWSSYNLIRSIDYHLKAGVPNSKLLIGLPYYGYEWETVSSSLPSNTTGNFSSSRTYSFVKNNASGNYTNRQYEPQSETPYYTYLSGGNWRQAFVCDEESLGERYDVVKQLEIAGIGIWALGYDNGYTQLWDLIEEKFTDCSIIACNDTIYDRGGEYGQYRNDEDYTLTIAPTNASAVNLTFLSFDVEAGFDSLWIYDGATTSAPLIGGFSGTSLPPVINSTGSTLTLKFYSDGATRKNGWKAVYSCTIDTIKPTTVVSAVNPWETSNFTTSFTDNDNVGGSGIQKSYYQVIDFDGTEWRANANNGFFADNFDVAIHPEWDTIVGNWSINNNELYQSNEAASNTNISAYLNQSLSNRYLYQVKAKIDGSGNSRRAGFHFFADNDTLTNRGNSYFVWFRVDDAKLQIYKVVNDVFGSPVVNIPLTTVAGQLYDYKIIYDRVSGKIILYRNDTFITSWIDNSPIATGNYISFRTGNANMSVAELKVYRSRYPSVTVTVGPNGDIRYQNPNPLTPSGKIKSIVDDNANNISTIAQQLVNVDWTPPTNYQVNDGVSVDIDTTNTNTQLAANWSNATDSNSGVASYLYAIGTTAGDSNVVGWTANALNLSFNLNSLSLTNFQDYYVSIRSVNAAGLDTTVVSDGVWVILANGINDIVNLNSGVYPNPFNSEIYLDFNIAIKENINISITNNLGQQIFKDNIVAKKGYKLNLNKFNLATGVYYLNLNTTSKNQTIKLIKR